MDKFTVFHIYICSIQFRIFIEKLLFFCLCLHFNLLRKLRIFMYYLKVLLDNNSSIQLRNKLDFNFNVYNGTFRSSLFLIISGSKLKTNKTFSCNKIICNKYRLIKKMYCLIQCLGKLRKNLINRCFRIHCYSILYYLKIIYPKLYFGVSSIRDS